MTKVSKSRRAAVLGEMYCSIQMNSVVRLQLKYWTTFDSNELTETIETTPFLKHLRIKSKRGALRRTWYKAAKHLLQDLYIQMKFKGRLLLVGSLTFSYASANISIPSSSHPVRGNRSGLTFFKCSPRFSFLFAIIVSLRRGSIQLLLFCILWWVVPIWWAYCELCLVDCGSDIIHPCNLSHNW